MNFTPSLYGLSPFSSPNAWPQFQTPVPSTFMDPELVSLAPSSPTTFPAPPLPLVNIPLVGQASIGTSVHTVTSGPLTKKARRFTSNGQPKSKQKDLDPEEDVQSTAPDAVVRCRWGACTETFRAGAWTAHAKKHRQEMRRNRDATGHARCLWHGCTARLMPDNMGKHVRSQHVGTYEVSCKHCGKTARADSYLEMHGLARDCPMRPGPSREASLPATASVAATPALSPSGSSTYGDPPLTSFNGRFLNMPSTSPEELDRGWLSPVLPLLAKSLRDRQQLRLDQDIPPASPSPPAGPPLPLRHTVVQTLVLAHPRPEPLLKPLEFDQFAPPPLPVPSVPAIPDTPADLDLGHSFHPADLGSFAQYRPFVLTADWDAPSAADVFHSLFVDGVAECDDTSFVFDSDAIW